METTSAQWTFHITNRSFQSLNNDSSTHKSGQGFFPCNNPQNLIKESTAKKAVKILNVSILPLIQLFGITTNVINLIVFTRQGLKDRINLCLFSLALADISFLLLSFSAKFYSFLGLFDEELGKYWNKKYLNTVLGPMLGAFAISHMMMLIISVERCVCVVAPFRAKVCLRTRNMAVFIVIMAVYILGVSSLFNLKYVTLRLTDPMTNTSRWVAKLSDFYKDNQMVLNILWNHMMSLTIPCLSLGVVVVTTSITVTRLRKTLAWRQQKVHIKVTSGDRNETALTKMLTVICLIYITTIIPSVTQRFFRTMIPDYLPSGKYCNTFMVVQTIVHMCEVTNSSVNFIVYFTMGSRFRDTVRQLFTAQPQRQQQTLSPLQPLTTMS